ncbi:sodium-dependent glucose transporter 1-like [Galendromus occidentalis]|uniref:Sodium-dependent glucose transporter 1-like n=1 Tax=Galendromus occidentalis TaxID=34638 RepID=A0AAJ7SID1_9ACAR|nr:sodium-dependent glucose transporter 1-like [Galendromus occidentalis]
MPNLPMTTKKSQEKRAMRKAKFVTGDQWDGPAWMKWFQTININLTCVSLGLIVSLLGPTLIDLSEIFHTSKQEASQIGMVTDIGSIVGPFLAGFLFKRFNAQLVCILSAFAIGASNIAIPLGNLNLAYFFGFISGINLVILENGVYVWLVGLWKGARPLLLLYSLMFGIGALFSPLIAKPFLSPERRLMTNATGSHDYTGVDGSNESQVVVPFAIIGSFGVVVASLMTVSFCFDSRDIRPERNDRHKHFSISEWFLTVLVSIYHLLVVFSETAFSRFLVLYAIEMYAIPKGDAAVLVSLFWIGFTVVRVMIIPLTMKLRSVWIVLLGQVVFTSACFLMYSFSGDRRIFYAGTFMFGFGLGPLYGGSLTWLTEHVTLRHEYLSLILIMTCVGSMMAVPIVSPLIESRPIFLVQTLNVSSLLMIMVFAAMVISAKVLHKSKLAKVSGARQKDGVDNPTVQVVDEAIG